MSTITIQQLSQVPEFKTDRMFNSMLSSYTNATRKKCAACKKSRNMSSAITLMRAFTSKHRKTLETLYGLTPGTSFQVFSKGTAFGFTAK